MHEIFVFGSNLAGLHGAGSAAEAHKNHGAVWGRGVGPYGNSYAIPTKDKAIRTMPLEEIKRYVDQFIKYAQEHKGMRFRIVAIGCGLAGYRPEQIAPMFRHAPSNCILPLEFTLVGADA